MHRSSVPIDFHSLPFALKACTQMGSLSLAQCLHSQALKSGFVSDLFLTNSFVRVYSTLGLLSYACKVFDESSHRDLVSYNTLLDGLVKAGEIEQARGFFDSMPTRDAVSWGTIIAGCAKGNHCEEAIELFGLMMELELKPDNIALVSTLSACAQLGELDKGKWIHDYIDKNAVKIDSFVSTALVDFYAKCGYINSALEIFESSLDKNLSTWNTILLGLAMHGYGQLLLDYFTRMVGDGVIPDGVSILGVLAGCGHAGLVDEARMIFEEMESAYGVPREAKHYGCMADLLARAGLVEGAMEMIEGMSNASNVSVWSGLLGGCRIYGNVDIAEKAAEHVMELKPEDGGVYSVLVSVYANAERWEDVVKIRKALSNDRRVKKNVACSSILLGGVMHEFVAGERVHAQSNGIYLVLNVIKEHMYEVR
ncbi:Pentatricopeptide repeat-containing protein [Turnera subulata]|uniref:Pentatricopeptide repeat-containing protein n=1 Tax=Turnera subulata TaxID=218843 RepID=A0A9Q0FU47_9ROSI|nr:Pentatricopeptide repeat-containing protein [Turnera subulata]